MKPKGILSFLLFVFLCFGITLVDAATSMGSVSVAGTKEVLSDFSMSSQSNSFPINKKFITNTYIPLSSISESITSLGVSGIVHLNNLDSYARVVLVGSDEKEYLVYDFNSINTNVAYSSFDSVCEETCALLAVKPKYLKIELSDALFFISEAPYSNQALKISVNNNEIKNNQFEYKLNKVKEFIRAKNLRWEAGETYISKLSFEEKKKFFVSLDVNEDVQVPNLQGLDYYVGGIFEFASDTPDSSSLSIGGSLPSSFNWNNAYGKNWLTSIKDQGSAGTCWSFASLGAMESQIKLYYNQPNMDINLSEQMLVDCTTGQRSKYAYNQVYISPDDYSGSAPDCFYPEVNYYIMSKKGVADEACNKYVARDVHNDPTASVCSSKTCSNWKERVWKNSDQYGYEFVLNLGDTSCSKKTRNVSVEGLKKILLEKGPLDAAMQISATSGHAMVLAGYETDTDGSVIWVFKNSWGMTSGNVGTGMVQDRGYLKVKMNMNRLYSASLPIGPFIPPTNQSYWPADFDNTIKCEDKDNDGYCFWGSTTSKPVSCASTCNVKKDCDDSDKNKNYLDASYNCVSASVNGVCGTANGKSFSSKPTIDLCGVGTASTVSGSGPWTWTCSGNNGGTNASCSASKIAVVNGTCGTANGKTYTASDTGYGSDTQCSTGTSTNTAFPVQGALVNWTCTGTNGGVHASCSASRASNATKVDGQCGDANGKSFSLAPTTDLCSSGTASTVSGSGPWTWTCIGVNGGTNANCSADKSTQSNCSQLITSGFKKSGSASLSRMYLKKTDFIWDGNSKVFLSRDSMGITDAAIYGVLVVKNLTTNKNISFGYLDKRWTGFAEIQSILSIGTNPMEFIFYGQWTMESYSLYLNCAVNGTCGTANGKTYAASDTSYGTDTQCSFGTSTNTAFPTQGASVTWICTGSNGGASANCSASRVSASTPVNGTCGTANGKTYTASDTSYGTDTQCSSGTSTNTAFPAQGASVTWTCSGNNGGTDANCSANRSSSTTKIDGQCGTASGGSYSKMPTSNVCLAGIECSLNNLANCSYANLLRIVSIFYAGNEWPWTCKGINGGIDADCTAQRIKNAVDGKCGNDNGKSFSVMPSSNLCANGTASAVSGSGSWTWTCNGINGGTQSSCQADKTDTIECGKLIAKSFGRNVAYKYEEVIVAKKDFMWDGIGKIMISGNQAGTMDAAADDVLKIKNLTNNKELSFGPINGSVWIGKAEIQSILIIGNNSLEFIVADHWATSVGSNNFYLTCSAPVAVDGVCGSSRDTAFASNPTTGLCGTGTASVVSGSGPWEWTCSGINGGSAVRCTANKLVVSSGKCGTANGKTYAYNATSYGSDTQCLIGTSTNASFPKQGASVSWQCTGDNGGTDADCSARRNAVSVNGVCGSASGTKRSSIPLTNLCNAGTASAVSGSGPWIWTCNGINGGTNANCNALRNDGVICGDLIYEGFTRDVKYDKEVIDMGTKKFNWDGTTKVLISGDTAGQKVVVDDVLKIKNLTNGKELAFGPVSGSWSGFVEIQSILSKGDNSLQFFVSDWWSWGIGSSSLYFVCK